jgi:hypothetical protein
MIEIQNEVVKNEITKWKSISSVYEPFFQLEPTQYYLFLLDLLAFKLSEEDIHNYIHGLVLLPIILNHKDEQKRIEYEQRQQKLMQPVFLVMKQYLETEYRNYLINEGSTGQITVNTNGIIQPVTHKALNIYIKRNNLYPLSLEDISMIENDCVRYFQERFNTIDNAKPTLLTIYGTDEVKLRAAHKAFIDAKLFRGNVDSWLYWFGGIPCNKHDNINWTYKGKPALLYFIENLCPDFGTLEAKNRKIKEVSDIFGIKLVSENKRTTLKEVQKVIDNAFLLVK